MAFDPTRHIMNLKGKDYLPVAPRIAWFREDHPDWAIITEPRLLTDDAAIFRATVMDAGGRIIATATKCEDKRGFPDFVEKAETGSIGRALALCGYGTLQAQDFDEAARIVDSPQARPQKNEPATDKHDDIASARDKWRDVCGMYGVDVPRARGELLNILLGRPRGSRDAVGVSDYMQACELLSVEGIPAGFFEGAGEGDESDTALFGPDEGVTPVPATATSAIAAGL